MSDLDFLRQEIQKDRIALQDEIRDGFGSIHALFISHKGEVAAIDGRVKVLEDRQRLVGKGLLAVIGAFAVHIIGAIFGHGQH